MILAVLRVMLLALLRDRGALAMAFLLPPLIYVIFATIFAGTTGDELRLRVAVLDSADTAVTRRIASAIRAEPGLRRTAREPQTRAELEEMVRVGEADAGVLLRSDPSQTASEPPIVVVGDASRAMATPIVAGQVQRLFGEKLPDVAYRRTIGDIERQLVPLEAAQRVRIEQVLGAIERQATDGTLAARRGATLIELADVTRHARAPAAVIYYAGAVAMMFLLFSAMQAAMTLIDERQSGLIDRLPSGAAGAGVVVGGKFLFLIGQGLIQVALIFLVAGLVWGVDITGRIGDWLAITVGASAAAAGLALALAALARTRAQAQALSNFMVLVLSAIGGSMVPRFLMPGWLQDLSWVVPNAWAIEAYHGLVWRDAPTAEVALAAGMLMAFGLATGMLAWGVLARERRL
jgi:ABC-2 type transport system permease protein